MFNSFEFSNFEESIQSLDSLTQMKQVLQGEIDKITSSLSGDEEVSQQATQSSLPPKPEGMTVASSSVITDIVRTSWNKQEITPEMAVPTPTMRDYNGASNVSASPTSSKVKAALSLSQIKVAGKGKKRKYPSKAKKLQGLTEEEAEERRLRTNRMEKERMDRQAQVIKDLKCHLADIFNGDDKNRMSLMNVLKSSTHFIWLLHLCNMSGGSRNGPAFKQGLELIKYSINSRWKENIVDFSSYNHLFEKKDGSFCQVLKEGSRFDLNQVMVSCAKTHAIPLIQAFNMEELGASKTMRSNNPMPPSLNSYSNNNNSPLVSSCGNELHDPMTSNHTLSRLQEIQQRAVSNPRQPLTPQHHVYPTPVLPLQPHNSSLAHQNNILPYAHYTSFNNLKHRPNLTQSTHNTTSVPDVSSDFIDIFNSSASEADSDISYNPRIDTPSCLFTPNQRVSMTNGFAQTPFHFTPLADISPIIPASSYPMGRSYNAIRQSTPISVTCNGSTASTNTSVQLPIQCDPASIHNSTPGLKALGMPAPFNSNTNLTAYSQNRSHLQSQQLNHPPSAAIVPRQPLSELVRNDFQSDSGICSDMDTPHGTPKDCGAKYTTGI